MKSLIDFIALSAAGYKLSKLPSILEKELTPECRGSSTIVGSGVKCCVEKAAAVNAAASHILELDDWLREGFVHAGSVVVPVSLAVAEEVKATWKTVLKAIIVGYEAAARMGRALGRTHYKLFHTTSTAGSIAASIVSSYVYGLSIKEGLSAANIAAGLSSGLWGLAKGGLAKPLGPMHAAWLGILSAKLALNGLKTVEDAILGPQGVLELGEKNTESLLKPPWKCAIMLNGYKFYPSCRHTHTAIEAALKIKRRLGEIPEDAQITVEVFREAADIAYVRKPRSIEEARFSLSFLTAIALAYGEIGLDQLEKALSDPTVYRLEKRIKVRVNPEYSREYPRKQPAKVLVKTGDKIVEEVETIPVGDPSREPTVSRILNKASELLNKAGCPDMKKELNVLAEKLLKKTLLERRVRIPSC